MKRQGMLLTLAALTAVTGMVVAAAAHLTLGFHAFTAEDARRARVARAPFQVGPLAVVDSRGERLSLWSGDPGARAWLVTFVYTRCPSICVAAGSEFQQLQAALREGEGVRLASLSFDRAHDSPEMLATYARRFRAEPARWLVAVPGTDDMLAGLLRDAGVVVIDDGAGGYAHNAAIHVIDSSGRLVALYDLEHYREALAFARRLA